MTTTEYSQKAAIYALLGRIFISELDLKSLQALQEQEISSIFEKLQEGSQSYLQHTKWNNDEIEQLASDYCHLFILPQKSSLSLRASHWMTKDESANLAQLETIIGSLDFDKSVVNADITALPRDHLGVLLYFVSSVYRADNSEIQKLGTQLIQLSLLPWILRFNEKLLVSTTNPLYLASGKLILELIDFEELEEELLQKNA